MLFHFALYFQVDQLSPIIDRYQQQDYDGNSNTIDGFQKNIHRWLQYDSTMVERCNQSRKEFFFPLDPSESIKWLDHDDKIPSQNKENSEGYSNHDNKSKSLPTRFLADVPNSCTRLRSLADQEARRSLGKL